ncbi:MAG: hypothetical protein EOP82_17305 [Variovorax sp.]|nr:MAG: hypothetical protein EOP82_17305 [Variovorax sp.]
MAIALVAAATFAAPARAQERIYLAKVDIEHSIIGHRILSKNLSSGMLSRWDFRHDGTVDAVQGSGSVRASGTWAIRDDGRMCITMMSRIGCRYWFRRGVDFSNSDTREPTAQTVAEVTVE